MIAGFEAREKAGELSHEDAQKGAIAAVKTMRYGKDGYFWIHDLASIMVMHPVQPELDGKNLSQLKDAKGKLLFQALNDTVKKHGAGLENYVWPKPGSKKPVPKLSYVAGFQPWGWIVATGI